MRLRFCEFLTGRLLLAVLLAVLVLGLAGCPALPSMQYCDEVSYTRRGTEIEIEAKCRAPIGSVMQ